jgi:hypothetical protein
VPTLTEAVVLPVDKAWALSCVSRIGEAQRAVPVFRADRVEFLRGAAEVLSIRSLIEEGARTKREIEYMGGRDLQKLVGELMGGRRSAAARFRKIVLESYFLGLQAVLITMRGIDSYCSFRCSAYVL